MVVVVSRDRRRNLPVLVDQKVDGLTSVVSLSVRVACFAPRSATAQLYLSTGQIDYLNLCRCYQFLDDPAAIAGVIVNLLAYNQEVGRGLE